MTLNTANISYRQSDTMSDIPSGGGSITANTITTGDSNNIFDDVSPLDRVTGAMHVRKVFASVQSTGTDKLFGAHTIITSIPTDDKINMALFNTGDHHDRRSDAIDRIAAYFTKGLDLSAYLFGTAYAGSRIFNLFQTITASVPSRGDVLILSSGIKEQYVRVSEVSEEVQSFTIGDDTFERNIVTISITEALSEDFVGNQITADDDDTKNTTISTTIASNSAKYYSARPLEEPMTSGTNIAKVDTVFVQITPNSLLETALVDQDIAGNSTTMLLDDDNIVTFTSTTVINAGVKLDLGGAITPDTLSFVNPSIGTITDQGGDLYLNGVIIGSVDYAAGTAQFSATSPTLSGATIVSFGLATAIVQIADTDSIAVTIANRGQVYTNALGRPIGRGSLSVRYSVFGDSYLLTDNGSGALVGSSADIGSGTVNYETGAISVTLGELPDVDSEIIFTWGNSDVYEDMTLSDSYAIDNFNAPSSFNLGWTYDVPNGEGLVPSTVVAVIDGDTYTHRNVYPHNLISDNGHTGIIRQTADGVSISCFSSGTGNLTKGDAVSLSYSTHTATSVVVDYPSNKAGDNSITITIPNAPLAEGSVVASFDISTYQYITSDTRKLFDGEVIHCVIHDDGTGGLIDSYGQPFAGSIDYTTGVLTFTPTRKVKVGNFDEGSYGWSNLIFDGYPDEIFTDITVRAATMTGVTAESHSETIQSLTGYLNVDGSATNLISNSIKFMLDGVMYRTDSNGALYRYLSNYSIAPNLGNVNLETTLVTLNEWSPTAGRAIYRGARVQIRTFTPNTASGVGSATGVTNVVFQIPDAPLKSGSLQVEVPFSVVNSGAGVTYQAFGGSIIPIPTSVTRTAVIADVTFDADGVGSAVDRDTGNPLVGVTASVNYDTGVVKLTSADVFDPNEIRYTTTTKTFTPVDSELIGVDSVRLPENGRVPVFQAGDIVVIHNSRSLTATVATGGNTDLGTTNLTKATAIDANGTDLTSTQFTVNLETGIVSWINTTGLVQPITVNYTIEDMALLEDVQIDGTLTLSQPTTHDYPIEDTVVSNAVVHGDMHASVGDPFDQATWTGVWSDERIGSDTLGEFNNNQFPIVVSNQDCIEERWLLQFTTANTINVIGEQIGQVMTGVSIINALGTIAPINPNTGLPYFTIDISSFGGGWSSGNCIRFNTNSSTAPVWLIQSVDQGAASDTSDGALGFCIELRGARNQVVT